MEQPSLVKEQLEMNSEIKKVRGVFEKVVPDDALH